MFFPIRSDRPLRSTPYVNYALIAVNVLLFVATTGQLAQADTYLLRQFQREFELELLRDIPMPQTSQAFPDLSDPGDPDLNVLWELPQAQEAMTRAQEKTADKFLAYRLLLRKEGTTLWQFLTYQFMHSGPLHLIGNMIFLWVFGNNVEDRLGKLGYLFFYLAAGVLAGLAHWLTSDAPVLGASGSVAGVTGAFLALFPRTRIGFIYFWIIIGFFEVPAMIVVIFFFLKDALFYAGGVGNVAYTAHLGGTLAGFTLGMGLLLTRLLPREPYDLLTLVEHKRRRDKFRKIAGEGYQPWEGRNGGKADGPPQDPVVLEARRAIAQSLSDHDHPAAAARYADLLRDHPGQVLSQRMQADVANQLMRDARYDDAAEAYGLLLATYPSHPEKPHYQLMLGLIYVRYLDRPADAKPLLEKAAERLDGGERDTAQQLLDALA